MRGEFDTLHLYDESGVPNVKVPMDAGGKDDSPEPFTRYYPQYGEGGERQLVPATRTNVNFDKVDIISE